MIEIKSILCPVDFSEFSRHALAHAVVIAHWYEATVTVFHAYAAGPPPVLFSGNLGPVPVEPIPSPPAHKIREAILGDLKRFADSVSTAGAQVRFARLRKRRSIGCRQRSRRRRPPGAGPRSCWRPASPIERFSV